ncbi:hypothetical protein V7S43_008219 [Phytophthora oleae]|uniref:Uncharacterized protein n=1 Tax=Phytophthora oleae TaxID=2107226 RepID=A0ABD3FL60_9STRA
MNSWSRLLLLQTLATAHYVSAGYHGQRSINIATVVSMSDGLTPTNSSTSLEEDFEENIDVVLVGNDSVVSTWLDTIDGYTSIADSKILYQTEKWSLIENGTHEDKLSSYWARFQAVDNTSASLVVCATMAEWNSSYGEDKAALSAVDIMTRVNDKCGENDTIAVAFTSAVSNTAAKYLEGEIAVNDAVAPFNMIDVDSELFPEATDRLFVRLANGLCPRDESALELSSLSSSEAPLISLFRGEMCAPFGSKPPKPEEEEHKSDWKRDLKFIVPVGVCVFVLGCAGLVYLLRKKKKEEATKIETTNTPKAEEIEDPSSLPYVLTVHPV